MSSWAVRDGRSASSRAPGFMVPDHALHELYVGVGVFSGGRGGRHDAAGLARRARLHDARGPG